MTKASEETKEEDPPATIGTISSTILADEIFGCLTLADLDESTRKVSREWNEASHAKRAYHLKCLNKKGTRVKIFGLTSAAGAKLNGTIGTVAGKRHEVNGRFPVKLAHSITGVEETKAIKPSNLNIFVAQNEKEEEEEMSIVNYTKNSKLRTAHGMILDQILTLARWESNIICGNKLTNTYESFVKIPRSNPEMGRLNSLTFTYWHTSPALAGYHGVEKPLFDSTVDTLADQEDHICSKLGTETKWKADGPNGKYVVRNFVRFMRSWEKERITGEFWVMKVVPTGTIMVLKGEGELGPVYLVKGMDSVIGDLCPSLPCFVTATLLPVYNSLVYDGMLVAARFPVSIALKGQLETLVESAVTNKTVITQGKSSALGLWDSDPPPLPPVTEHGTKPSTRIAGGAINVGDDTFEVTKAQEKLARKILKIAAKKQSPGGNGSDGNPVALVFRRFGYTKKENPMKMVVVLNAGNFLHTFSYKGKDTYTVDEFLQELLVVFQQTPMGMPDLLMPDELSVVKPLQMIMEKAYDAQDTRTIKKVSVRWYPPPSKEETAHAMFQGPS
mmetsp:Transcript_3513/g.6430  ORF Transcript_3513/g.6430 Transcript_3513/m.6430 type:complete len:559 (-) Transcript_3513:84-1760(-)